jgi:hypothetical protein
MEPSLKKGDKVYLLRKNIKTKRPSTKLDFKKLGPFKILEKTGPVNYRLQLPKNSRLHPVFHISLLEPTKGETPVAMQTELQPLEDTEDYEVEEILDMRNTTKGQQEYLVKWKSYDESENSWEPTRNLNCDYLVKQFHQHQNHSRRNPAEQTSHRRRQHRSNRPGDQRKHQPKQQM